MNIIPVINCPDRACVEKIVASAKTFLPDGSWVHLDVTDGIFSTHTTWHDPMAWADMKIPFNLEVHLMVARPEDHIASWCAAGAKRIIVHSETLTRESAQKIIEICRGKGAEAMLASNPETPIETFASYLDLFSAFLILAVHPGPAGQAFNPLVVEKIKALRREGAIIIEVDGGMNPETAKLVKDAGATDIASGAYIFESDDPKRAYEELKNI